MCVRACVCMFVRVCACLCVCVCVRACVHACVLLRYVRGLSVCLSVIRVRAKIRRRACKAVFLFLQSVIPLSCSTSKYTHPFLS